MHTFFSLVWLGIGIWRFVEGDVTNMLICFAISSIWIATKK